MDVNFSNVLEGTRQYFQGIPAGSGSNGCGGAGGPSPEQGSPPSAAQPQDPLEPEAHIIHKATVMQQARQRRQLDMDMLSPPPPTSHIPAQPPPTVQTQRARALTVLEARRPPDPPRLHYPQQQHKYPATYSTYSPQQNNFEQPVTEGTHHTSTLRTYPTLQPQVSRDPTPRPYHPSTSHQRSTPHYNAQMVNHKTPQSIQSQQPPPQHPAARGTKLHVLPQRDYEYSTRVSQHKPPEDHRVPPQDHRVPPQDHRVPPQDHRVPPQDHRVPPQDHRVPPQDHRVPPPDHRVPPQDHRVPPQDHRIPPSVPNYRERVPSLNTEQRHQYVATSQHLVHSSRTMHNVHPSAMHHNMSSGPVHTTKTTHSSGTMDSANQQHNRVPPIHPHHPRISREYPSNSKQHLHTEQSYSGEVPQYQTLHSSSHSSPSSGVTPSLVSEHQMQNYQMSSVGKYSYEASPKHNAQMRNLPLKQSAPSHQQRMTVSVTSLVNQMNVMRQQSRTETTTTALPKHKKESPLDLSVKTVRIPADSTAKDEMENMYDKREGHNSNLNNVHPSRDNHSMISNQIPNRQKYQIKPSNGVSSHKVDFLPNFNPGGSEKPLQYRESNPSYAQNKPKSQYEQVYSKSHAIPPLSYAPKVSTHIEAQGYANRYEPTSKHTYSTSTYNNRRIDSTLPKIDLTITVDEPNKDNGQHPQIIYNSKDNRRREEDYRKREANHIPNNIPQKVARYESWNIDRQGRPELHQKESNPQIAVNHYVSNGTNLQNTNQRKLYDQHSYKKSENIEPHSSKYLQHQQPRPQIDLYYQHSQKGNVHNQNYDYNMHERNYQTKHEMPAQNYSAFQNQHTTPADKRVLSILRNSLEAKSSDNQKVTDSSDDCIIIQSDDSLPHSVDFADYQNKKVKHSSERNISNSHLQEINPNNPPYKMHVPRAVDSIKYDSDSSQKSLRIREDLQTTSIPIKTETSTYTIPVSEHAVQVEIDIAARIRTKGELKGFIQPVASADGVINIIETKIDDNNLNIKCDTVVQQPHRRRLFSKSESERVTSIDDKVSESKTEPPVKISPESKIFDFPDSESENDTPNSDNKTEECKESNLGNVGIVNSDILEKVHNIKSEVIEEDPFWAETCDNFLEELKSGKVKKVKRKRFLPSFSDDSNVKDSLSNSIKIEKSVIVNVVDIVKSENQCNPFLKKIKEEVQETIETSYLSDSSDEDQPLIKQKIKKENNALDDNSVDKNTDNIEWKCPVVKLENNLKNLSHTRTTIRLSVENSYVFQDKLDKSDDKVSSDDEQLIVKKRKQDLLKEKSKNDLNSSDSDSEVLKSSRLRSSKGSLSKPLENLKLMKTPTKEEIKLRDECMKLKKPGFGDGSDFRPGWEEEVYKYKRSLRMPARLIHVTRPPHWPRVSTSLPDLDPCPNSPAPSTSTEELFTQKKYSHIYESNDKLRQELDTDSESECSFAIPKCNYDSEASSSTVISTASKKKNNKNDNSSILDVLIQKCGKKDTKKKKNKDENNIPKTIPKSLNPLELLATPSLGLDKICKKGTKRMSKEKVMEELFYLGSFRKQTVSNFRDAFISNTDGLLGATEEFSPVVLKSRTRTETRVLKQRATMKEVFGDERPASAPPVACTEEDHLKDIKLELDTKLQQIKEEPKTKHDSKLKEDTKRKEDTKQKDDHKIVTKKFKKNNICSTMREGLRSSRLLKRSDSAGRLLRIKKRNNFLKALASKKMKNSGCPKIKKEPVDPKEEDENKKKTKETEIGTIPVKKRFKRLFTRRKLSSGFDYIRKKKKLIKKEDMHLLRKRCIVPRPSPESVHDIQKEIKNWIIKKSVGETVLHRAARLGYIDCVAYCLEKMNVPPSCRDNAGYTPLHEACSRGHLDIARLLLQYGAGVSEAAQGGIRPLHEACENGYTEIIRLLLAYGADPLLATYSGQTPVALSTGKTARFLQLHLNDLLGNIPQPWHFHGPSKILDPPDSGYDPLTSPPSSPVSSTSPSSPPPSLHEMICAPAPMPPLYRLRPASSSDPPDPGLWCLLQDLATLLQVKSRDALLKQIHCGDGPPRDSLKELKMQEFLDRAQCQQLMAAGEKINIRASKIALVRYTEKVKQLLNIEVVSIR